MLASNVLAAVDAASVDWVVDTFSCWADVVTVTISWVGVVVDIVGVAVVLVAVATVGSTDVVGVTPLPPLSTITGSGFKCPVAKSRNEWVKM